MTKTTFYDERGNVISEHENDDPNQAECTVIWPDRTLRMIGIDPETMEDLPTVIGDPDNG